MILQKYSLNIVIKLYPLMSSETILSQLIFKKLEAYENNYSFFSLINLIKKTNRYSVSLTHKKINIT